MTILNQGNVHQWLNVHQFEPLHEMQISAAKEALVKAEEIYKIKPDEYSKKMLEFFQKNASSIIAGNEPYRSSLLQK